MRRCFFFLFERMGFHVETVVVGCLFTGVYEKALLGCVFEVKAWMRC